HRLVIARREAVGVRHLEAPGNTLDQGIRVELEQARVAAHHAAGEGRARQGGELLLLERFELARRELELLRDVGEREPARLARRSQLLADPGERGCRRGRGHGCNRAFSQTGLAEAPGIPATRDSGAATDWQTPVPAFARPGGARSAARATATRESASSACCSAPPACAPRPCCPAGSGSGRGRRASRARRARAAGRARRTPPRP